MLRGLPFTKLQGRWSGHSTVTRPALLLKVAPPESLVPAAAARSVPRIPAGLLLPVHLLHADAQDKYHGCIRNDMMLMMNESR